MLKNILNLNGVSVLNKASQKAILGGSGTCGYTATYYDPNGNSYTHTVYGVSQDEALWQVGVALHNGYDNARWCCDSCSSASWLNIQ